MNDIFIDGTEPPVLFEYCAIFNCELDIWYEEDGDWGEVYENGTGIGIFGAIAERTVDITISGVGIW